MTKHLEQKAFFDGEVELQRFDVVRHPMIERMNAVMLSHFWRPEEINVTQDKADYAGLAPNLKHIFTSNLKRQIVLDTKQGREPLAAFLPLASSPENECAITEWSFQELIHSRSYTHIIRGVLNDPSEIFDTVFDTEEIVMMADDISVHYDKLIQFNKLKAIIDEPEAFPSLIEHAKAAYDEYEHKKAFYRAVVAVNALEGIRFYVSFACSWAFAELYEKMEGNAKIIKLICRDENNHLKLTQMYLTRILKEDPDFVKIAEELQVEMIELMLSVAEQEKDWARYLFKDGAMLGLNEQVCCDYIDWLTSKRMAGIGLQYPKIAPVKNPLPWTQHWIAGDIKQTALQEAENDSYLLGVLTGGMADAAAKVAVEFGSLASKQYTAGDVVIYGREGCPYCVRAKSILDSHGISYRYVDDIKAFPEPVPETHRTFPAVVEDGVFIGGYTELVEHLAKQ
ncbi:coil containing protein [Vibrio phage 1.244.A._10N.261.54.C3]|nr:coil containing protein [Vibrio phage 1.244.A._10N.261.54.C3]AUR98778.1 coil containing protein [Vibrio phage 1.255.O._10N.286.45.F1]